MAERSGTFTVEYTGRVAIVTICNEKKLNALNQDQYFELSQILREVATHDEVYITMLTAKGRFFSACVFLSFSPSSPLFSLPSPFLGPGDAVRREGLAR